MNAGEIFKKLEEKGWFFDDDTKEVDANSYMAFAEEYHQAKLKLLSMPDVGQTFYCHRKKWLKEEGCRWQCNECIEDAKKYGE